MQEKNHIHLQQALETLPEMEPDARLWSHIEAALDFDIALTSVIPSLPQLEPDETAWDKLEGQLPPVKPVHRRPVSVQLFTYLPVAACISLIIVAALWLLKPAADRATFSYSQEIYLEEPLVSPFEGQPEIQQAMGFIQTTCESQLLVCSTPEFQELKSQLDELTAEMQKLKEQQTLYGQEPELIKAQIKLENLQAQITKELIRIIVS